MENRQGLIVDAMVTQADGTAERDAGLLMVHRKWRRNRRWKPEAVMSLGADKAYDTRDFVATLEAMGVQPHIAQNSNRPGGSAVAPQTVAQPGYEVSQRKRPLIEKAFGWMKQTGGMRRRSYAVYGRWAGNS